MVTSPWAVPLLDDLCGAFRVVCILCFVAETLKQQHLLLCLSKFNTLCLLPYKYSHRLC